MVAGVLKELHYAAILYLTTVDIRAELQKAHQVSGCFVANPLCHQN